MGEFLGDTADVWLSEKIELANEESVDLLERTIELLTEEQIIDEFGIELEADGFFKNREDEYDYLITFEQAVKEFKELHRDMMVCSCCGSDIGNPIELREAWNNWTDSLNRDGTITDFQYKNWDNPF